MNNSDNSRGFINDLIFIIEKSLVFNYILNNESDFKDIQV